MESFDLRALERPLIFLLNSGTAIANLAVVKLFSNIKVFWKLFDIPFATLKKDKSLSLRRQLPGTKNDPPNVIHIDPPNI